MAIDNNWLLQKFDFTTKALVWQPNPITGLKEPVYYDTTEANCFIDSAVGSDAYAGTAAAPWKSLSKAKSAGATYWANGKVIMMRGVFDETCSIDVSVRILGVGGLRGRAVFIGGIRPSLSATINPILLKIKIYNNICFG